MATKLENLNEMIARSKTLKEEMVCNRGDMKLIRRWLGLKRKIVKARLD